MTRWGILFIALVVSATDSIAQTLPGVTRGSDAFLVMPAKPVEGLADQATNIQWTENGKGLLIWHRPPIKREFYERESILKLKPEEIVLPPAKLTLWDRSRKRLYPLRGFENLGDAKATFSYAQAEGVLAVHLSESKDAGPSLTLLNVSNGSSKLIGLPKGLVPAAVELSPQEKFVKTYDRATGTFTLYTLDGSTLLRVQVAELHGVKPWVVNWLPSQDQLVAVYSTPKFMDGRFVDFDGRLGAQTDPFVEADLGDARFPLRPFTRMARVGDKAPVRELWIANEELRPEQLPTPLPPELAASPKYDEVFVASSAEHATMAVDRKYLAYIHRGAVVVSEILKTSKAVLDRMRADEERDLLMEAAAKCGLAVLMFTADSDGEMPDRSKSIAAQILPYLEDRTHADSFTCSCTLSTLAMVKDPKSVEIGFIESNQGRAVVFADGHAEWRPK